MNKIIHDFLEIVWNFSFCVQLNISLHCCARLWDIKLNTQREIPYISSCPCIILYITWLPQARLWAANIIDFIPEAQTLFIVVQGVDTGKPEVVSMHKNKNKVIQRSTTCIILGTVVRAQGKEYSLTFLPHWA